MDLVLKRGQELLGMVLLVSSAGAGAADAKIGADVFATQCAECHSTKPGKNKKGPSLFAVLGRAPAALPDFKYSDAMRLHAGPWSDATIDAYIADPRRVVPGGTMKYDGLPDAKARADLLAFLLTLR